MDCLQTDWWSIGLPPEWWAEREEGRIVIGDRDDVGTIEISTLIKPDGVFSSAEVAQMARTDGAAEWSWQPASVGALAGVACCYREADTAVREWYLASGALLLFVTYSCILDHAGLDDAAVDDILASLTPAAGRA